MSARLHIHRRAIFALCLLPASLMASRAWSEPARAHPPVPYGTLPLAFEANHGQAHKPVAFLAHGGRVSLQLTPSEILLAADPLAGEAARQRSFVRLRFHGGSRAPRIQGGEPLPGVVNYFRGSDPNRWLTGIPTYAKVRYEGLYPGIDLVCYGTQGQMEYDLVVAPHADPRRIRLTVTGAGPGRLDARGDLLLRTSAGEVRLSRPAVYQDVDGVRTPVRSGFTLGPRGAVRFRLAAYDAARPLVIDPVLIFSTYLGGAGNDIAGGVAVDASGNAYVTGVTTSLDFPVAGPYGTPGRSFDAFVAKLDPTGSTLLYSTYLGGSELDAAEAIAVDRDGNACITGHTQSSDFPLVRPLQPSRSTLQDTFVAKLGPSGALLFSTYFGGFSASRGIAIATDDNGNVYVTGVGSVPTTATATTTMGNSYLAKISASGAVLLYSTRLGGSGVDAAAGVAVDAGENVYVTGRAGSPDFPVRNAVQPVLRGPTDAFVVKLTPLRESASLLADDFDAENGGAAASGYAGFSHWDVVHGDADLGDSSVSAELPVDGLAVHLGGSGNLATTLESKATFSLSPLSSIFPAANASLYRLEFRFAGSHAGPPDSHTTLSVEVEGVYAESFDVARDAPFTRVVREMQVTAPASARIRFATPGGSPGPWLDDVSFSRLTEGADIAYSTFLGGGGDDAGTSIAVDPSGVAHVTGLTASADFPVLSAAQSVLRGPSDAFLVKLGPSGTVVYATYLGGSGEDQGTGIALDPSGGAWVTGVTASPDFPLLHAFQTTHAGVWDTFVTRVDAAGAVELSTFLGGSGTDQANAIAVDGDGNAYVAGYTDSPDFPTIHALQPRSGAPADAFVAKIVDTPAIRLIGLTQARGGNRGNVTTQILGVNFPAGPVAVRLTAAGQPDLAAIAGSVLDATAVSATFALNGAAPGPRDVTVTFSEGTTLTLAGAFTVVEGGASQVWVDILGRGATRVGVLQTWLVVVGNRGTLDAADVPLHISGLPLAGEVSLGFEVAPPPGSSAFDWSQAPKLAERDGARTLDLLVSNLPAGSTLVLPVAIKVPGGTGFALKASTDVPYAGFSGGGFVLDPAAVDCVFGAVKVVRDAIGLLPGGSCTTAIEDSATGLMFDIYQEWFHAALHAPVHSIGEIAGEALLRAAAQCLLGESLVGKALEIAGLAGDAWSTVDACLKLRDAAGSQPVSIVGALDPNAKLGPSGAGAPRHLPVDEPLRYAVFFENVETASAPAAAVVVDDQLDPEKVDLESLTLGTIRFGNRQVTPPAGATDFSTDVDLRPEANLIVRTAVRLDRDTGLLRWRLTSLDPATGLPPLDARAGFLPPNAVPPEGEGSVFFTVMPKRSLATGTDIRNRATIVFDANPPLTTGEWSNTIDADLPASAVAGLPGNACPGALAVAWSGSDVGSGIRDYTIFLSEDGGPPSPWLRHTAATAASLATENGHRYELYSVARDMAGNVEEAPAAPDAAVTVVDATVPAIACPPSLSVPATSSAGAAVDFTVSAHDNCSAPTVACSAPGGSTFVIGTTAIDCKATDLADNAATCHFTISVAGALDQTKDLKAQVERLGLAHGLETSLVTKLGNAANRIATHDTAAACGLLLAFTQEVKAKTGQGVPPAPASDLLAAATRIRRVMGCS